MNRLLGIASVLFLVSLPWTQAKRMEGRPGKCLHNHKAITAEGNENWAFLSKFCFSSETSALDSLIEFDPDMGFPNLLFYAEWEWPSVYHSTKNCKEREQVINVHPIQINQTIKLSDPDNIATICEIKEKKIPASNSTTTPDPPDGTTKTPETTTISDSNSTIWYEIPTTEEGNTPAYPENNLTFAEEWLRIRNNSGGKSKPKGGNAGENFEKLEVSCNHSAGFKTDRQTWWFIAISNCEGNKGLDVRYELLMTNGEEGDFFHEHFSADEFYVLPVLLTYTFAYILVMIAVVMLRHLLHSTYMLFLISIVSQHIGIILQTTAYVQYAFNGVGSPNFIVAGQLCCSVSESVFLLLLVLMAKGYTIIRGLLKPGYTVKLTIFIMGGYIAAYVTLFVYQATAFDPGEVLYLYESSAGYSLIVRRLGAWCIFAFSTLCAIRKYSGKRLFYLQFFICGTLWFYALPLFILTANFYINKWERESYVTAALLTISFSGHLMFVYIAAIARKVRD